MGYVIAMAGKGGTGKTTVAALIAGIIKEKKIGSVLAIDADPNSNLGELLGIEVKETVGQILDEISAHPENISAGMPKDRFIELKVQSAVGEGPGVDLLTMGKPEGPGCYCYVNTVLRGIISKLIKDYDFIIIDNEAGLEHLSRRTIGFADALVVISDASGVGLKSARRIADLARELKIGVRNSFLLLNRANAHIDARRLEDPGLVYLGRLPFDTEIEKLSLNSEPLAKLKDSNPVLNNLKELGERIWKCN